jgi:PAS domain-containing protein
MMNSAATATTESLVLAELDDLANLKAAVIVLDRQGRVRLWNLAARPIFGIAAGDATDRPFEEVAGARLGRAVDRVMDAVAARRPARILADHGLLAISVMPNSRGNVIVVRPNEEHHS